MDKLIITTDEVAAVSDLPPGGGRSEVKLPPPVALWLRVLLAPLFLVLPLLGLVSLLVWLLTRHREPRLQQAWIRYLFTLFVLSSFTTTAAVALTWIYVHPLPTDTKVVVRAPETPRPFYLDEKSDLPSFKETTDLSTEALVSKMQPAVLIVSRGYPGETPSRDTLAELGFGTGILLHATDKEYLVATARHVVKDAGSAPSPWRILVWGKSGGPAEAKVLGTHHSLDLSLLRVARQKGSEVFVQPVSPFDQVALGSRVVVFGHPQGMFYSVSDGLVSRKDDSGILQVTAPISPGVSGGPVYNLRGNLLGIVTSQLNKDVHPQAENLNFAVRADALLKPQDWDFAPGEGRALLEKFRDAAEKPNPPVAAKPEATPPAVTPAAPADPTPAKPPTPPDKKDAPPPATPAAPPAKTAPPSHT